LERPFFSQSKNPEQKRGFEKLIFPKIVHDAQKIQAKVLKIGPFLRDCLIFAILGISSKKMLRILLTLTYAGEYSLHRWRVR
jgi:hypothetical protein